jgi:hypothetical protein
MPAKKTRQKQKSASSSKTKAVDALSASDRARALEELISEVQGWPVVISLLAAEYQLPDLESKKGLKECYKNIGTISVNLR